MVGAVSARYIGVSVLTLMMKGQLLKHPTKFDSDMFCGMAIVVLPLTKGIVLLGYHCPLIPII